MKKLLLILLLLFITVTAKAQQYIPFPDSSARWLEFVAWFEIAWEQTYFLQGDTTIDNKDYTKVYFVYGHTAHDTSNSTYVGGIREDSMKRVYFTPGTTTPLECIVSDSNDLLLYDFDASIGDTFTYFIDTLVSYDTIRYLYNVITGIDSIEINDQYRRRLEVFSFETLGSINTLGYWIEGIGSTLGLFSPIHFTNCGPGAFTTELSCFFEDDILVYSPWSTVYCSTVKVDKIFTEDNLINVFPNPTSGIISIKLSQIKQSIITVFNIVGKEMVRKESDHEITIIDISFLQNGIYILNVIVDDKNYNYKIFKN